jgi:uncharacterized membrane protein SirB2
MSYLLLKQIHMSLALLSIAGFIVRWCWRMMQSRLALTKMARIMPHVVDTLFLGTAIMLSTMIADQVLSTAWFSAKIIGLVLYILLGMIAMHAAPSVRRSLPAFIAAVLVFAWIVSVARTKMPLGLLQHFIA